MRFESTVKFWSESAEHYVPGVGYEGGVTLIATTPANVTDVGTNRSAEVFGDVKTTNKVVRLLSPVAFEWSYLTIDDGSKHYKAVTSRDLSHGTTLIVSVGDVNE